MTTAAAPAAPVAPVAAQPTNGAVKPTPVTPPAAPTADEMFEITVAGKTEKRTKAELLKLASKAGFADKVTQQAKEALRALAEAREKAAADASIWDDDEKLEAELEKRGKLDKLARKRLEAKVNETQLNDDQKAAKAEKERADKLQKDLDDRTAKEKAAKQAETSKAIAAQAESQLRQAAERAGMLPLDGDGFDILKDVVKDWVRLKLPWDPDRIVATAQENIEASFDRLRTSATKGLKGAALVAKLGPDVVKEVLRFKAEEFRNGGARPVTPAPQGQKPPEQQYLTPTQLAEKIRGGR